MGGKGRRRSWTCPACGKEGLKGRSCPDCKAELVRVSSGDDGLLLRLRGTVGPPPPGPADGQRGDAFNLELPHGAVVKVEPTEQTRLLADAADLRSRGSSVEVLGQVASVFDDVVDGLRNAPALLQLMHPRVVVGGPHAEERMQDVVDELRGKDKHEPLDTGPRGIHVEVYKARADLEQMKITCREPPSSGGSDPSAVRVLIPLAMAGGFVWFAAELKSLLIIVPLLLVLGVLGYAVLCGLYNYTVILVDRERLSSRQCPLPTLSGWSRPASSVKRVCFSGPWGLAVEQEDGKLLPLLRDAQNEQRLFVKKTVETALGLDAQEPAT